MVSSKNGFPNTSKVQQVAKTSIHIPGAPKIPPNDVPSPNPINVLANIKGQGVNAASQALHIDNPKVARIRKETQAAMMMNANPMIKPPMVISNTSAQEISS